MSITSRVNLAMFACVNGVISKTTRARWLRFQIQNPCFRTGARASTFLVVTKILTEMHCCRQNIRLNYKKVCNADPNARKPPTNFEKI